ncbi:MAG: hypothetical protein ACR2OU_16630, partial [Thermomicrobiales bacterium]
TACGSLGGSSKETPPPPTATVEATQRAEIPATAIATPASISTTESSPVPVVAASPTIPIPVASPEVPVAVASAAASPAAAVIATSAATAGATPNVPSVLASILAGAPSSNGATPAAGASPSAATPVAAMTVANCEPPEVPPFTGNNSDYVVTADLNFRVGPGSDCDAIGDPLSQGVHLTVVSDPVVREDDPERWVQVNIDGQVGWVASEFIEPYQP